MPGRIFRAVLVVASLAIASACGSNNNTTPTPTPTTPTTPTVTETFSGELKVNGAATYAFVTATSGTVTATLSTVDPSGAPAIGVSLGTWNGTACTTVIANDGAQLNAVVTGSVSGATALCVRVYDAGRLSDPLNYTVTVVHP